MISVGISSLKLSNKLIIVAYVAVSNISCMKSEADLMG